MLQQGRRSFIKCIDCLGVFSPFAEPLVHEEEEAGQDEAHKAHSNVRNSEERILSA